MKIYKQIIATGHEWQPCIHCGERFVFGEIITAMSDDSGHDCRCWYCAECFEKYWFSPLPVPVDPDDNICLVVFKDDKMQICPKPMTPAEYMVRSIRINNSKQGSEEDATRTHNSKINI